MRKLSQSPPSGSIFMGEMNMKLWLRILIGIVGVVAIFAGIREFIGGSPAGLVKCDSDNARETLKIAFNDNQYAKSNNITFVDLTDISETGYEPDKVRSCHGSLKLSDQQVHSVDYQLEAKQDGTGAQLRFSMK
jgi:hypothetical protein